MESYNKKCGKVENYQNNFTLDFVKTTCIVTDINKFYSAAYLLNITALYKLCHY